MTRIKLAPPKELCKAHLAAEYHELPRVFRMARRVKNAPADYVLGKGHIIFFYDKLLFLAKRQAALIEECKRRGINAKFSASDLRALNLNPELWGDYTPTESALALNRNRILERLKTMKGLKR